MVRHEVAHADGADAPGLIELLKCLPGADGGLLPCCAVLDGVRPVDQVQIQIPQTEPGERHVERLKRRLIAVRGVAQLAGHKNFLAGNAADADALPNAALVAVGGSGVNEAVSRRHCVLHRRGRDRVRGLVCSKADARHFHAVCKCVCILTGSHCHSLPYFRIARRLRRSCA